MADSKDNSSTSSVSKSLDLSSLSSMSLGPDWGSGRAPKGGKIHDSQGDKPRDRKGGSRGPRKDRRKDFAKRRETPERVEPFKPILEADFYAEEEPFKVLANAIKTSYRTFELFEIAQLILQKPDRWVCVAKHPEQREGEAAKLYASVPDGLPFLSEADALNHVFKHYLGEFFEMETVEVDPPSGTFQLVHKCGMTGKLLAPPNYHRYQAICRQHHATHLGHVPYDRFESKLESVRDEESIAAWLESMKTITRYTSKSDAEAKFDSLEDARLYLMTKSKDALVRPAFSARFSGKSLHLLDPKDIIRRSIEYLWIGQQKFPLSTANHLRGRLRRMNFAVYKKGSKGVSYVCAVKRRFRKPDETLADNLQALIDFIEAHPNFPAGKLAKEFLGIRQEGDSDKESKAEKPVEKPDEIAESAETADPESALKESEEKQEKAPATSTPLSESEKAALLQLKRDLKYLISEGYVIEYSDGKLFVPPIREEEINRLAKKESEGKESDKDSEATKAEVVEEGSVEEPRQASQVDSVAEVKEANEVLVPSEVIEPKKEE